MITGSLKQSRSTLKIYGIQEWNKKNHQNENKNTLQNLWDAIKAVLRERTIAIKYLHHKSWELSSQ